MYSARASMIIANVPNATAVTNPAAGAARFRNIGNARRRDRFMSIHELGVRSLFLIRHFHFVALVIDDDGGFKPSDVWLAKRNCSNCIFPGAVITRLRRLAALP